MKIQLISDLHTEFLKYGEMNTLVNDICNIGCDVRILAGDIGSGWLLPAFLKRVVYKSKPPVIYVPGNHDWYGKDAAYYMADIEGKAGSLGYTVLNRSTTTIKGQRFIGCTGWYHCIPQRDAITDATAVDHAKNWIPREGEKDRVFLEDTVFSEDVVITHYLPHKQSLAPQYAASDNRYFYVPYDYLIEERKPKLWLHGHTHSANDYTLDCGTRVVCNPRGYPGEKTGFIMKKTIRF